MNIGIGLGVQVGGTGVGVGGGLTFLLRDDFTTARAPLLGRLAEPGPGTLTLVQTDGQFSTSSGKLNFPVQSTPAWADQGFYGAGRSRVAGRAIVRGICDSVAVGIQLVQVRGEQSAGRGRKGDGRGRQPAGG